MKNLLKKTPALGLISTCIGFSFLASAVAGEPTLYECSNEEIGIVFRTFDMGGRASFAVSLPDGSTYTFQGPNIQQESLSLGKLVGAILTQQNPSDPRTLSLLLPPIEIKSSLMPAPVEFKATLLQTTQTGKSEGLLATTTANPVDCTALRITGRQP